jgi:hypothetical protein
MKKWLTILMLLTISILIFISKVRIFIDKENFFYNSQINNLAQNVRFLEDSNFERLLSKETAKFEFMAEDNNLGTISFLFNNHKKINSDVIKFRIREKGNNTWYYEGSHDSSKFDIGQFYPFGFDPISDSKGHIYQIEIESQKGNINDSISISNKSNFFQVKYIYTKGYLSKNKSLIPHFLAKKALNYLSYFELSDYVNLIIAFASPFLTYLLLKTSLILASFWFPEKINMKIDFFDLTKKFIKSNPEILSISTIYIATRIQFLKYSQYWDANWYKQLLLDAISKTSQAPSDIGSKIAAFLTNFNFLGHPSMGYMGVMSLSQGFGFGNIVALNILNMLFAVSAIWGFYNIAKFFFPDRKIENIIITLIFAFNPLFYGSSIFFNLDFPILIFTVLVFESFIYKRSILFFFWSLMLVFTKETGIYIYLALISAYFIVRIINKRTLLGWGKTISQKVVVFLPVIIFGLYLIYTRGRLWNDNDYVKFNFIWSDSCTFCFGLNPLNIKTRIFQMFIMNFSWLMSLGILITILKIFVFLLKPLKHITKVKLDMIITLVIVFFAFIALNLVMVVMNFSRYVVPSVFFLTILFYISTHILFNRHFFARLTVLLTLLILITIQVFNAIDPSAQILFGTNYIGKHKSSPIFAFNDAQIYNSQFTFLDGYTDMINDKVPNGSCIINDLATSYYFTHLKSVGYIENLNKTKNSNCTKYTYVFVPWMSNEKTVHINEGKIYNIMGTESLDYKGYPVIFYHLQPI